MYKKIILAVTLGWSFLGFSQTTNTDLTNNYQPPQTVANETVRMLPGFHANSGDGNFTNTDYFLAKVGNKNIDSTPPKVVHTPSSGENYVYSRTYLAPVTESNPYAPQIQSIQYFDGLGRPKQSIAIKASPTGQDLVTTIPYDGFGRQVDSWLPTPMASLKGGIQSGVEGAATTFYSGLTGDNYPFSHKVLENSPLDRIQQQIQAGDAWQSRPVTFGYETNGSSEVLKFTVTTPVSWFEGITHSTLSLTSETYYASNQLYKNTVTDEDGNKTEEFKNGEGQTLLVRKMEGPTPVETYYVYNAYNQLAYVLSPLASKAIKNNVSIDLSDDAPTLSHLAYQYRYDGKGRLAEKKLPGKGWEYMVYDKADRLILTRDSKMAQDGKWLFSKYDQFGRVVYTGITPGSGRKVMQDAIKDLVIIEKRENNGGFNQNAINIFYSKDYYTDIETILSVNYYDTYPVGTPYPAGNKIRSVDILTDAFPSGISQSTQSLPTASFVKNIENDAWTKNYTFYDRKGRAIGSHSINHLGGYTRTESELDFAGIPQKTFTFHKRKNTDVILQINERFVYNLHNRALEKHYHEVVGKTPEELLMENSYNDIGQLTKKKVGNNIQEMEYLYNIRGWMTKINNPDVIGSKLFAYEIKYNNPAPGSPVLGRFNGNISEVDWVFKDIPKKRYSYQYDGLNRLLNGIYSDPDAGVSANINGESIEYDFNGNITRLYRNTKHGKSYTPVQIDNLTYTYENGNGNSNRLKTITDSSNNSLGYSGTGQTIEYDVNGNMTVMPDKGILQPIAYNFLNLSTEIKQNGNTTNNLYRADGVKLKKTYNLVNQQGSKIINTEYLDGFQYSTPNIEPIRRALEETDDATLSAKTAGNEEAFLPLEDRLVAPGNPEEVAMILSFFPTSEGYYDYENFRYIYQYKDHLGNVRVSFVKNSVGDLQVMDSNDYYPFGLSFMKPFGQVSVYDPMALPYNYKYNGKELQETGMYDYGWRMFMPDIGRWNGIDQLAEKFSSNSTYNYVGNNPILIFDPDGRDWYYTNDGQYLYNKALNKDNSEQFFKDNNIEGAKYAFESNTMSSMHYAPDGYIYNNSEAGGGLPVENGRLVNIEAVEMIHPKAIAKRNEQAARYRLRDAEAKMFGRYAYGFSVGYSYGNSGYNITLAQNFGTGQAKLLGTTYTGLAKDSFGFNFQLNALAAYGTNLDGSSNNDVFGQALGYGTEVSGSYILGGSASTSADGITGLPASYGTRAVNINLGTSVGGGISRTYTTDLTPALNRFLQFNWIQHKPQFD